MTGAKGELALEFRMRRVVGKIRELREESAATAKKVLCNNELLAEVETYDKALALLERLL